MKQSDPVQLVKQGSLERPGPIGRLTRLALGLLCAYALYQLILYRVIIISKPVSVLPSLTIMVVAAILIINYVVNIGFGKSFGRWPSGWTSDTLTRNSSASTSPRTISSRARWITRSSPEPRSHRLREQNPF